MNDAPPTTHETAPGGLEPHRGTLILGGMMAPEGAGMTKAGMICGMICCILILISIVIVGLIIALGVGLGAMSN